MSTRENIRLIARTPFHSQLSSGNRSLISSRSAQAKDLGTGMNIPHLLIIHVRKALGRDYYWNGDQL